MGENGVAGGSPEGCLQKTALVGELVPSHQKKKDKNTVLEGGFASEP